MARAVTIAVWVWSVNAMTVILNHVNPFHTTITMDVSMGLLNSTAAASNMTGVSGIGLFGLLLEFVGIINLLCELILGPLLYVPSLLNMLGLYSANVIHTVIVAAVWIPWAFLLFGVITGRALREIL